jgi:branched-chain amino acid transport system substrate-binding protein
MAETGAYRQADSWSAFKQAGRAIVLGGALFLAACQAVVPRGAGPESTPPPKSGDNGPVEPGLPTDLQRHRIALLVPTTGANAGVGQSIANATTLALMDTSAKTIRITTYDTSHGAVAAANAAIRDGNKLILGPLVADDVKAVAPLARSANVPIISFSNDTSVAGNGVFLMGYTPVQAVSRVVDYARSKGVQKFGALVPRGVYGERAGTALLRAVETSGGTVVSMQTFDHTPASMLAAVKKLGQASAYDAVLIADGGRVAMQIAPVLRKNGGANAQILGTELWNTENALAAAPGLRGAWFASVSDTYYRQLATKYRTRFGTSPYRLSSLGYDAVLLTIRIAQDWKVGTPFPAARLTDEGGFTVVSAAPSGFGR